LTKGHPRVGNRIHPTLNSSNRPTWLLGPTGVSHL